MNFVVKEWILLVPALFNNMAVVILCAYIFSHSAGKSIVPTSGKRLRHLAVLTIIGSALGIYGTLSSISVLDVQSNIRNIGPIIAGLLGGPVVGGIAGAVSGFHRFFLGGSTAEPCAIAAVFAGVFSGWLYLKNGKRFVSLIPAVAATVFIEFVHSALILLMHPSFSEALASQRITMPVRMVIEGVGIGLFSFIITDLVKNQKVRDEKQKVERELSIAREIQMSIVPKLFPPQPGWPEVQIYGMIQPAREVAGDFYDFFKIDDHVICFVIGDVSDKGVPASLYMAVTKTMIKAKAEPGISPSEILTRVNIELCDGNDSLMFVTLFCGILDTSSGTLHFCNAGHNPPVYLAGKSVTLLEEKGGMALGIMKDATFHTSSLTMQEDATLFLYTDGMTDAADVKGAVLGDGAPPRLVQTLSDSESARVLVERVLGEVNTFQGEAPQFDDITLLAIRLSAPALAQLPQPSLNSAATVHLGVS